MNRFSKEVHIFRVAKGEIDGNKRHQFGEGLFIATIVKAAPPMENEVGAKGVDPTLLPIGLSRVSGSADIAEVVDNPLKSTLLLNDVMDRYSERAKKLRAESKRPPRLSTSCG